MQEIAAASTDLSAGMILINTAVNQMNHVMQHHAAAEQLAATSEGMNAQAEQLDSPAAFFQLAKAVA